MPLTTANGIQICYETFGPASGRPLLLISGLGSQLLGWYEPLCELFVELGHRVIRFDNRDVGLSEKFGHAGLPDVLELFRARARGEEPSAPYTLWDMADDAAGVLDAIGIGAAHIAGTSMGGMIAQAFAIRHPGRALSLTSIMASTGHPGLPGPTPDAQRTLLTPAPLEREAFIAHTVETARTIGSAPGLFDAAFIREQAGRRFDRAYYPEGAVRQLAAVAVTGSRREALGRLATPTLVIHGALDPLMPLEAGLDTAQAVPGAELLVFDEMGHDLPPALWPRIAEAIAAHTAKVRVAAG